MWFLVNLSIPENPVSNPAYGLEYKYCYLSLTNRADCIFIHFSDWTLKDVHYIVLLSVQSIISKYLLCFPFKVNFLGQPVIRMWFLFFHVMEAGNLKNWVLCHSECRVVDLSTMLKNGVYVDFFKIFFQKCLNNNQSKKFSSSKIFWTPCTNSRLEWVNFVVFVS